MKKNLQDAIARWLRLVRREMPREILLCVGLPLSPEVEAELQARDQTWKDRECLCLSDPQWVVRQCELSAAAINAVEDDTLPNAYPHAHFGESLYSGLLGGKIRYIGTANATCSGAEPLVHTWEDIDRLRLDDDNPILGQVSDMLKFAADNSGRRPSGGALAGPGRTKTDGPV